VSPDRESEGITGRLAVPTSDQRRVGQQHFRYLAAVQALFTGWCEEGLSPDGRAAIPFDKLANIAARTWTVAGTLLDQPQVYLPVPLEERQGMHGPGQALVRRRDEPPSYFLDIAYALQEALPERTLFSIRPYRGPDGPVPNDYRTRIMPVVGLSLDNVMPTCPPARKVLVPMASALRGLAEDDMRALGTHGNARHMALAIEYHARLLQAKWNAFLNRCRTGTGPDMALIRDMQTSCSELRRKLVDNEGRYAHARRLVCERLPEGTPARVVFDAVHRPENDIWTDRRVVRARELLSTREAAVALAYAVARMSETESGGYVASSEVAELAKEVDEACNRLGSDTTVRGLEDLVVARNVTPAALRLLEGEVRVRAEI